MKYNVDDVIFCTVKKIEGTTVFLEAEGNQPGSMMMSEVAAGRIRNIRDYVSRGRKIVCKILRIAPDHLELSLRRVTAKEKDEVLERYKKERALVNMLKTVGEKPEPIIEKIKESYEIVEFIEEVREDIKVLEKFVSAENAKKLFEIISEKEGREKVVERVFVLKSFSERGVEDLKEVLDLKEVNVHYLGSSMFSVSASGKDFKGAEGKMEGILEEIEKRAKKMKVEFRVKKEK